MSRRKQPFDQYVWEVIYANNKGETYWSFIFSSKRIATNYAKKLLKEERVKKNIDPEYMADEYGNECYIYEFRHNFQMDIYYEYIEVRKAKVFNTSNIPKSEFLDHDLI